MEENVAIPPSEAILVVVTSYLLFLFLGTAFIILFGYNITMLLSELLLIVIPLGYMLSKKVKIGSYIGLKVSPKHFLLGVGCGAILFFFDVFISIVLVQVFGPSETVEESNTSLINMSSSPGGLLSVIAGLALAGVCEEFTFRGFLQTAVNSRYSFWIALIVSSLAFGFLHFDPQAVYSISAFLIGLILGYIYHRWHSYVISATAHATLNLIVLALMLIP